MTRTIDRVDGPEFAGGMEFRFFEVDVTNYDDDGNGDGEAFNAGDAGMSRLQHVDVDVDPGASSGASTQVDCVAEYDYTNGAIRLFYQSNDGTGTAEEPLTEVASNSDEGAVVRVKAIGR